MLSNVPGCGVLTQECSCILDLIDTLPTASGESKSIQLSGRHVTRVLERVMESRGKPAVIRCDNGPEFTNLHFIGWCEEHKVGLLHIQPGKPMQNGYVESFNGKLRDECDWCSFAARRVRALTIYLGYWAPDGSEDGIPIRIGLNNKAGRYQEFTPNQEPAGLGQRSRNHLTSIAIDATSTANRTRRPPGRNHWLDCGPTERAAGSQMFMRERYSRSGATVC